MFTTIKGSLLVLTVLLLCLKPIDNTNILFLFGGGNLSHKLCIWPLVLELANRGHNVTFVSSNAKTLELHPNIHDLTPKLFEDFTKYVYKSDRIQARIDDTHMDIISPVYEGVTIAFCDVIFKTLETDMEFNDTIYGIKWDLMIINAVIQECSYFIPYKLGGIPFILFDSTMFLPFYHGIYGVPLETSWIPDFGLISYPSFELSLWDRIKMTWYSVKGYQRRTQHYAQLEDLYKKHFGESEAPSFLQIERNANMVFINSHHSMDFARSLPPMFVNIGGMQCWNPIGELSEPFKSFMDEAEEGVILISFGSTIDLTALPDKYLQIFFNTMKKFSKVRFIWRWDGPIPENQPKNLLPAKWLPQREILNHSKLAGFMSHCGMNSIIEATCSGVPVIGMPLFGDQDLTAYRIQIQELGLRVPVKEFSQEVMDHTISQIIHNSKFKENMKRRSRILLDRVQSPVQEAAFWTEFVLRNPDTGPLKPMFLDQPWYTRTLLDVHMCVLGFTVGIGISLYAIVKYLLGQ